MSASAFTPAVLTVSSGAGSGSGEKNYITNPSMASATTGWNVVGDFTLTRTTAASELPREYTTGTGIKLVATSGTQSTADYMYFDFNLDDVDLGKKLKIQWSQKKIGTYSAGQLAVVITSQADRTTALITPQTTAIPASDLDFVTSFDSTTTAALSLVIRATADMTTGDGICISDVIVGPGEIVQGAAVGEYETVTSYTITAATTNPTPGSGATYYRSTFREGSYARIRYEYTQTNAGSAGSGTYYLPLPSGLTIDFTRIAVASTGAATNGFVGTGLLNATNNYEVNAFALPSNGTNRIALAAQDTTTSIAAWGSSLGPLSTATVRLSLEVLLPIAEWAGSGTVNLLNSNVTEANAALVVEGLAAATINSGTAARFNTTKLSRGSVTYSNSTGYFTVPVTDYYQVRAQVFGGFTGTPRAILTNATDNVEIFSGATGSTSGGETGALVDCTSLLTAGKSYYIKIFNGPYTYYTADVFANLQVTRVSQYNTSAPVGFGLASATDGGLVSTTTQTLAGEKTFTGNVLGSASTGFYGASTTKASRHPAGIRSLRATFTTVNGDSNTNKDIASVVFASYGTYIVTISAANDTSNYVNTVVMVTKGEGGAGAANVFVMAKHQAGAVNTGTVTTTFNGGDTILRVPMTNTIGTLTAVVDVIRLANITGD